MTSKKRARKATKAAADSNVNLSTTANDEQEWTHVDLCDALRLPSEDDETPDHSPRSDILSLYSDSPEDLSSYERLQKVEIDNALNLLNGVITTAEYTVKDDAWRRDIKAEQSMGGKYVTNLGRKATVPSSGAYLTHYGTTKEKGYKCPHDDDDCNKTDEDNVSLRTVLVDQPNSIIKEATGVYGTLTASSNPQKCFDLLPVLCPLREQVSTVENLARDLSTSSRRVTPSRVRTTGVILLIATAAYHFANTGEPYDIMFASRTGSEEHMVYGCESTKARKKGIEVEQFENCLIRCHGSRPHPENDHQGKRNLRNAIYTPDWHVKTGTQIMSFLHATLPLELGLADLYCTTYLLKKAGRLDSSPEEIAAENETQRRGRVLGGENSGAMNTLASAEMKGEAVEDLSLELQAKRDEFLTKYGELVLAQKMEKRKDAFTMNTLASAEMHGIAVKDLSPELQAKGEELLDKYGAFVFAQKLEKRKNGLILNKLASATLKGRDVSSLQEELSVRCDKEKLAKIVKNKADGFKTSADLVKLASATLKGRDVSSLQEKLSARYDKDELAEIVKNQIEGWKTTSHQHTKNHQKRILEEAVRGGDVYLFGCGKCKVNSQVETATTKVSRKDKMPDMACPTCKENGTCTRGHKMWDFSHQVFAEEARQLLRQYECK